MNNTIFEKIKGALAAMCMLYNIPPTSKAYQDFKKIIEDAERSYNLLQNQAKGLEKQNRELQFENRNLRQILCKKEMEACRLLTHNDKLKRVISSLKPIIERLCTKDNYQSLTEVMDEIAEMKKIIEGIEQ